MARLPIPGGDVDKWAKVLNEYLLVSHNGDGTARAASVTSLATGTVGLSNLITNNPAGEAIGNFVLSNDGTNLMWAADTVLDVTNYGAVGDGVTDDTAAIQRAIDAAINGGSIFLPRGVYMITGLTVRNEGTNIVGDGRWATRIVRLSGTAPLINISGTGTGANGGLGHIRYASIDNIMLSGNFMPGTLLQSYYSDTCIYREINFIHCAGSAIDFVEVWDTRFLECTWEDCGSRTAACTLLRNSAPVGTFGFSTDNTNQIFFTCCRWEGFGNGAICLDGVTGGSTALLNGIFFISCKMETIVAAGPVIQTLNNTSVIFINQLYVAITGFAAGYSTPIDVIQDNSSHIFMTDVYVHWGNVPGIASSVAHIMSESPHMYQDITTFYTTGTPANASIWVETAATDVTVTNLWSNTASSTNGLGNFSQVLGSSPLTGLNVPLLYPGTFRVTDATTGNDLVKVIDAAMRPSLNLANGLDITSYSDAYATNTWHIVGSTGAAWLAAGKFQIEPTKGYIGINATPFTGIALLISIAAQGDLGLVIIAPTGTSTTRLMQFEDQTHTVQGMAFDYFGRPIAVGTPAHVTGGAQVTYANPGLQVNDISGNIAASVIPSPTAPGTIATITFSQPYTQTPHSIMITDQSAIAASLYVSARSATSFTVSTRSALRGGSAVNFDYAVIA